MEIIAKLEKEGKVLYEGKERNILEKIDNLLK
jgi:hypothetical protein